MLTLKGRKPLKAGGERFVFEHPERPDLVVKVIRPQVAAGRYSAKLFSFKARRRIGKYINFHRQIREYMSIWSVHGAHPPILARVHGIVDTDYGLGLVEEKLVDRDGIRLIERWIANDLRVSPVRHSSTHQP